ncbi:hypothetical protein acsn021_01640 [Anaerocolumna cellulosilytica]|uniref:Uncharacterized protein n=1 Tax=Anaerocolumna cellulosilytica TaxID=433286 RepID=A0A6S6QYU7_9FIRM|nr:DNA helicase [Anaerocolumna cellulosilytica]MBB5197932.1 hypothetical protein [Anaerocolumna cellulosilytica]BCJ92595.1 hypothetical protein acsn021_01640 [Anaerocolumna cellulosilytica]
MIQEIKRIVENYLSNAKLCSIIPGTVTKDGIRISEKLVIPEELVFGNMKKNLIIGDSVRLLRNHGGQQYFILEVIE